MLKVNEIFYSIEGEGQWQGFPTIFIRLSGCNLKCKWCDTSYENFEKMGLNQILKKIITFPCKRIKITGGEPLLQDIEPLIKLLKQEGYIIALETNGTLFDDDIFEMVDLICMDIKSPSSHEISKFEVVSHTLNRFKDKAEFKIVISDTPDLVFVEGLLNDTLFDNILLMPNSLLGEGKMDLVKEIKLKFPDCRYGLRLHEVLELR